MATKKKAKKAGEKGEDFVCPLCLALGCLRDMADSKSPFFKHMNNARIEFLEGIKTLIDAQIEAAKKGAKGKKSGLTKIKVED